MRIRESEKTERACSGLHRLARAPWKGETNHEHARARAKATGIKRKVDRPTGLPNVPQPI
jgi:hypothetical protein